MHSLKLIEATKLKFVYIRRRKLSRNRKRIAKEEILNQIT